MLALSVPMRLATPGPCYCFQIKYNLGSGLLSDLERKNQVRREEGSHRLQDLVFVTHIHTCAGTHVHARAHSHTHPFKVVLS